MPRITKAGLLGKTKQQVITWVADEFQNGHLTQNQFDKVSKYLMKLNAGKVITDDDLPDTVWTSLNL